MATALPVRTLLAPRPRPRERWPVAAALAFQAVACGAFWVGVLAILP